MSLSAASRTLKRIQDALGDTPLFLRSRPLIPTPAAQAKADKIREILTHADLLFSDGDFDPKSLRRRFRVGVGPNIALAYGVPLTLKLLELAPASGVELVTGSTDSMNELKTGDLDLLFWPVAPVGVQFQELELPPLSCVILVRADHPLIERVRDGQKVEAADLEGYKRIMLSHTVQFCALAKLPAPGVDTIPMPFLEAALALLERSDCLLFLSRQAADSILSTHSDFACLPTEGFMPHELPIRLIWHERQHEDPALAWLIGLIRELAY